MGNGDIKVIERTREKKKSPSGRVRRYKQRRNMSDSGWKSE